MKTGHKLILVASLGIGLLCVTIQAEDKPTPAGASNVGLTNQTEKVSYGIGMGWGTQLKRSGFEVNVDTLASAIRDVLADKPLKMTEQQARETIVAYQHDLQAQRVEKNRKEGEAFLAENKKKADVKTHVVALADGKTAELQYKIITQGTGEVPKSNDVVAVNYRGTLINGKEIDSSARRGQPAKFPVNRVVRGWTEALQLMKVGSKWDIYLPSALAYGDNGSGPNIEPGSTLIFEVELVGIDNPQPPTVSQPLTSDIIKVPSAEELKKGAKVEVIKAEDLAKLTNNATQKTEKKP